jgi:hypothetical protein
MAAPWEIDWQGEEPAGGVDSFIQQASAKYDIPEDRLRAVIGAESNFDPNAVSRAGAQGLMQLMPDTAKELGVTDAFDPAQNVDAGARYLRQQFDRFGNWDDAHAAYNAGPARVARGGDLPNETKAYVSKINATASKPEASEEGAAPWEMPWSEKAANDEQAPWEMAWGKPETPKADNPDFQDLPSIADAAKEVMKWPTKVVAEGASFFGGVAPMAAGYASYALNRVLGADPDQAIKAALEARQNTDPGEGLAKLAEVAGVDKAWIQSDVARGFMEELNEKWIQPASQTYFPAQESLPKTIFEDLANLATFGVVGAGAHAAKGFLPKGAEAAKEAAPDTAQPTPATEPAAAPTEAAPQPAPAVSPAVDPMQAAAQKAIDLTNETGVEHTARQVDGQWTAVPREDAAPAPAPDVLNAATVDDAIAAASKAAFPDEAEKAPQPVQEPVQAAEPPAEAQPPVAEPEAPVAAPAPLEQAHVDQAPVPVEAAAGERPVPAAGMDEGSVDEQRAAAGPESVAQPVDAEAAGDHQLGEVAPDKGAVQRAVYNATNASLLKEGDTPLSVEDADFVLEFLAEQAKRGKLTTESFAQSDIGQRLDTATLMALNESLRADPSGTIQALRDRLSEVARQANPVEAKAAPAEPKIEATPAAEPAAPAQVEAPAPQFTDFTTPKGEVKTFATAKLAQAFAKMRGLDYTPRQDEGGWVLSKPVVQRSAAQLANDRTLSRRARNVQPEDDLTTLLRKNGGINAAELTRDGADPKDIADSMRFGAARKTGGMSLDAAAELMGSHGFDVYDEHGLVDASKARELLQQVLDGDRVYTPEGMEIRQQRAEKNTQAGFGQDDEILRQADLHPDDGVDAGMVARAAEIDEATVSRLAIQYEGDDAGFIHAVQEFLNDPNHETAARGETPLAEEAHAGETVAPPTSPEEALARLKAASEAVRAATAENVAALIPELDAARQAADKSGASDMDMVHALEARPSRPIGLERRLQMLENYHARQGGPPLEKVAAPEPVAEVPKAPADAGVSLSAPAIESAPPALLRRVTVDIDRYHEGEGVRTEQVSAREALAEHDAEISAFEKLLECVSA